MPIFKEWIDKLKARIEVYAGEVVDGKFFTGPYLAAFFRYCFEEQLELASLIIECDKDPYGEKVCLAVDYLKKVIDEWEKDRPSK